jgi:hypothetical protein
VRETVRDCPEEDLNLHTVAGTRSCYDAPCSSRRALMIKVVGGCILDSSKTRDSKRRAVDGLA